MHRTLVFLIPAPGHYERLSQPEYARLLRGDLALPQHAGRTLRVADWYVETRADRPTALIGETYSLVALGTDGRLRRPHDRRGETANHLFYEALANSSFDDPDDDPCVQHLRMKLGAEYAWRPSDIEREALSQIVFCASRPPA